jgi:hypothetical protein
MSTSTAGRTLSPGVTGLVVGTLAGLVALGPALGPGYLLAYDMVFVPDQPLTARVLGTDGSVPRAVPNDLMVVLASTVLPGDTVQKVLLLAAFVLAGWGVGRMMPTPLAAAVAAATLSWNAYVFERLAIGHWGFLLGLAALPWAAGACAGVRRGQPGAVPQLCLVVALAGLAGSTALVLVAVLVLALLAGPGWRGRVRAGGWAALAMLGAAAPWLVPALREVGSSRADPAGVAAFAARADTPLGVVPSLATTGGIWNRAVWPAERGEVLVAVAALILVVVAVAAGAGPWRRLAGGLATAALAAGAVGLAVAVAATVPWLDPLVRLVVVHLPGGGLVRDGQKFVALALLPLAACAGMAADRARRHLRSGAWVIVLLPVAVLPSLAWGLHGRLQPVDYPASWPALRAEVDRVTEVTPGAVAVFPFTYYRRYAWNGDRVVLDPVPRLLDSDVIANDDLPLSAGLVAGEDPRAARVRAGLDRGDDLAGVLAGEGVRYVVAELDQPDIGGQRARLRDLPVVWRAGDLELLRVPGAAVPAPHRPPPVGAVLGALTLLAAAGAVLLPRLRRRC